MLKFANFTLVLGTLATASVLYNLEHTTRAHERTIARAQSELVDNAEAIKLLKAEWSSLTRPERIQQLAEKHLNLKKLEPDQIVSAGELPVRLGEIAKSDAPSSKDTIEDVLKKMQ